MLSHITLFYSNMLICLYKFYFWTAICVTGCSAVIHYSNNYSYRVFAPLESNHFLHFSSNNIDETRFVYVFITMLHHDTVWKSTASVSK